MTTGRLLVVDDDPVARELLVARLVPQNFTVLEAGNGEEALQLARAADPDLILLDVMMPGTSGLDVCRGLKTDPVTQVIPIILVTALHSREEMLRGLEAGAEDFISKPFYAPELLARVRSLVRLRQLHRELQKSLALLQERHAALQRELEVARAVQAALLPQPGEAAACGIDFAYRYLPSQAVGGDFLALLAASNGAGIFISDITGHGVASALYTSALKALLRSHEYLASQPAELLARLNREVAGLLGEGQFVTAAYVFLDQVAGAYRFSLAGHPSPLVARGGEIVALANTGLPLGIVAEAGYQESLLAHQPEDVLLLYTDGLLEAVNGSGAGWDTGRLEEWLLRPRVGTAADLLDDLWSSQSGLRACRVGEVSVGDDINVALAVW